jgi:uncharacterized protein
MRAAGRAAVAVAIVVVGGGADPRTPARPGPAALPRLVVVTHTTGFRHDSIAAAEDALQRAGRAAGLFETVPCCTADDVRRLLTPTGLRDVAAVAFVNTTGDLGIPDLDAFVGWVAQGHGFAGVHSASDTYHGAPAYLAMLGNQFATHGAQTEVEAVVESPAHPAVAHLGARYRAFDEIYRFVRNNRGEVTPLLTLDRQPDDGLAAAGTPADLPLAWSRQHGQGRVFYTALGHRDELWRDERFLQHVVGGLRWALAR